MPITQFTNHFNGHSLIVSPQATLNDVPDEFARHLTDEHYLVYANPQAYFSSLKSHCHIPSVKLWLGNFSGANSCEIEINTSSFANAVIVKIAGFEISLRKSVTLPATEVTLHQVYSVVSCVWHRGFPEAGGLHEPRTVSEYNLRIEGRVQIPDDAIAFYTTYFGDSIIACEDDAYWYLHEKQSIVPVGLVADVLSTYFSYLSDGRVDEFDSKGLEVFLG